jgi:hypothetical protein
MAIFFMTHFLSKLGNGSIGSGRKPAFRTAATRWDDISLHFCFSPPFVSFAWIERKKPERRRTKGSLRPEVFLASIGGA